MTIHGIARIQPVHKGVFLDTPLLKTTKLIFGECSGIGFLLPEDEQTERERHILWSDDWEEVTCQKCLKKKANP